MTTGTELVGIAAWAVDIMERLGGPGAALLIAAENLFPPLPSEVILPLAGFTASQGGFSLAGAIAWTTLGSVVGAVILYWLGAAFGRDRFRRLWARIPLVNLDDLDRTEAWFARHGRKAVLLGRMIPVFRSLISVPAGIERMPVGLFLLLTTLGSLVWNSVLILAGYRLGESWDVVQNYVGVLQNVVIAVVVVALVIFVVRRVRARRLRARQPRTEPHDAGVA